MLDVHSPHSAINGWRDFFLHLFTITVGLLIALGLEGAVEWLHHRHLMHQAQAALYTEIKGNAGTAQVALDNLHAQQKALQRDVAIVKRMIAHPEAPISESIDVSFSVKTFENVSWKTAQATGAIAFMTYDVARQYSDIYNAQDRLEVAELQAARDTTMSLAAWTNIGNGGPSPTREEATLMKHQIEIVQGQLMLVDTFLQSMNRHYDKFLGQRVLE